MIAAPPPPTAAVVQTSQPVRYGFAGADLGADFAVWRASSEAARETPCRQGRSSAVQVCTMPAADLGGGYQARDLTFTFIDETLAAIDFKTSIDGFDNATAALKRRFGQPMQIVRDSLKSVDGSVMPHVTMIWRNGRSTIRLSDPMKAQLALSVRLSLDADAQRLASPS
jgi:hypothetical protein